jgi:hypothetical protein
MTLLKIAIINIFWLTFTLTAIAQIQPQIKISKEKDVIKRFNKISHQKKTLKKNYKVSSSKNGDTLVLNVMVKETQSITMKFTFNLNNGYCDYQSIEYTCDSCIIDYLDHILKLKYCRWKKINKNTYRSSYFMQTEMEVQKYEILDKKIIYRYVDYPKGLYKITYKKLKNAN